LNEQGPASDEQWPIGASKRGAEGLDGAPIRFSSGPIVCEVVDKGSVNHSIGSSRSGTKAFEIFERTAMYLGSRGGKFFSGLLGASKADYLMTSVD
jgi:hypothetical protein